MAMKEGDTFTLVDGYPLAADLSLGVTGAGYFVEVANVDTIGGTATPAAAYGMTFVPEGGDGLTPGQTYNYIGRVSLSGTQYTYTAETGTLSVAAGKVDAVKGSASPTLNRGQYLAIANTNGWTATMTDFDDMVVLDAAGNTVNTGAGSDCVILTANGSDNLITMADAQGSGVLNVAGSNNTVTAAGNVGFLTGGTIGTITRNRTTYTVASISGGMYALTSAVLPADVVSSGEISGDSNVVNIGGEGYLNILGRQNTVSVAGRGAVLLGAASDMDAITLGGGGAASRPWAVSITPSASAVPKAKSPSTAATRIRSRLLGASSP